MPEDGGVPDNCLWPPNSEVNDTLKVTGLVDLEDSSEAEEMSGHEMCRLFRFLPSKLPVCFNVTDWG